MSESSNNPTVERLPSPPGFDAFESNPDFVDRRATLSQRLFRFYQSLHRPEFVIAISKIEGAKEKVDRLRDAIQKIGEELEEVPTISVALLGPSRHGKSTLLNALAGCPILPMSDIKPCTASIVSLKRADDWDFKIRFITEKRLERERRRAVRDANDYLQRMQKRMMGDEQPDDPRYLHTTLQRFIELFKIEPDLSPIALVEAIESAEIPLNVKRLLGQSASPRSANLEQMKTTVEKYLSTKDIYWTIVDTCDISGPFENWHPSLELVDVPGTNDTDPHRTQITNSLRSGAKAVAICTSDSNLGNDIQSWLRNSSVLGDFLEATERSRQQLFILRTKFDSHHPEIDESQLPESDEEAEDRAYREAIARHKEQQTESYCEMFRNIASPLLPMGQSEEEISKREEMIERINGIRVFFISALAYEAFEGRSKSPRRTVERLKEQFHHDVSATGIPELRDFVNQMAATYLEKFYFQDLERQLGLEVDRLVRFFRQQWTTFEAEVNGGSKAIAGLVDRLESEILPWLGSFVAGSRTHFEDASAAAKRKLTSMLDNVERQLDTKLSHRIDKWNAYYWNSLKATARKQGIHTTGNGQYIDINQDIAGLFVDELSLSWASFRDDVISASSDQIADEICRVMLEKLDKAATEVDIPEATAAIDSIVTNLSAVSRSQRGEFRRQVDEAIQELESIRKPAYDAVQGLMEGTYRQIANEGGTGCQQRMRKILIEGAQSQINNMWTQVKSIVTTAIDGLLQRTAGSLDSFGKAAATELSSTAEHLKEVGKVVNRERLLEQMEWIRKAALMLWDSISDANQILIAAEPIEYPIGTVVEPARITSQPIDEDANASDDKVTALGAEIASDESPVFESVIEQTEESVDEADEHRPADSWHDKPDSEQASAEIQTCEFDDLEIASSLTQSELYKSQKRNAHRVDVDDVLATQIIAALEAHSWKLTTPALSEIIGMPTFRLRSVLPSIQRLLNVDGQQLLTICRSSDTVEINQSLLIQEFLS